jgi:hypothetical protein
MTNGIPLGCPRPLIVTPLLTTSNHVKVRIVVLVQRDAAPRMVFQNASQAASLPLGGVLVLTSGSQTHTLSLMVCLALCQLNRMHGTVRVFGQSFSLEDAIGSHACSLEALTCV